MNKDAKIFVAGHRGLVGSAVVRELQFRGFTNLVTVTRDQLDLRNENAVRWFFSVYEPEYVFLCAARVGGIKANMADMIGFFCDNMRIEQNVISNAAEYKTKKLVFLGSNCIYPPGCPQPIKEEYLLTGSLEKTNEAYALAKIAGVKLCEWFYRERGCKFVTAMPCNLFGPNDNFNPETAHVVPGMISRMHAAKLDQQSIFEVWGNANTKREFLYSWDLASALFTVMEKYDDVEPINTGSGIEMDMQGLAHTVARVVGYDGNLWSNPKQPSGVSRKILDNSKIFGLGWKPETSFVEALKSTYADFLSEKRTSFCDNRREG